MIPYWRLSGYYFFYFAFVGAFSPYFSLYLQSVGSTAAQIAVLMSLMAFCTACSVDGVQTRDMGHTSRSTLDTVEAAIGFHLRDWWQPTKANFFGHLKKPQIIAALNEAGLSGAARDAEKMKKGDAAEHAEFHMKDNRWVPGWMCTPRPQAETETTEYRDDQAEAA